MTFDRYDTHGVYDLRLSTGESQTIVFDTISSTNESVKGYPVEPIHKHNSLRVGHRTIEFRIDHVIGRRFEGAFRSFDCYEFLGDDDTHPLRSQVPDDADVMGEEE